MKLHISNDLSLPIDAATQTFAFIARKGAGKTYAAGKLAECLLDAHVQVVILDSVGNWWGLRLMADGKTPAYDIPVIGGLRGDIPLEATGGHLIADIIADTGRSLIIDVSQFSKADRQRFATAFAERLWKNKKAERHPSPLHLIIEESQLIVPESVRGDSATMVGIYEEIIRLGRNYGIGVSMISQRPQSVNKEVLNQTECLFALQVNGKHERIALRDWITYHGAERSLVDELPSLPVGTAYVWSPQWLGILQKVKVGQKKTFDASATPKVGSAGSVLLERCSENLAEDSEKVAVWGARPFQLVSLLDMLKFNADSFVEIIKNLEFVIVVSESSENAKSIGGIDDPVPEGEMGAVQYFLDQVLEQCRKIGLRVSTELIECAQLRLSVIEGTPPPTNRTVREEVRALLNAVNAELGSVVFMQIPAPMVEFYEKPVLFGDDVANNFSSAAYDITEAGKCLATDRSTACVLHLMRVLELGLNSLAKALSVQFQNTNWNTVLDQVEARIKDIDKDPNKPPTWRDDRKFYSAAANQFRFFKDSWRNYAMHGFA